MLLFPPQGHPVRYLLLNMRMRALLLILAIALSFFLSVSFRVFSALNEVETMDPHIRKEVSLDARGKKNGVTVEGRDLQLQGLYDKYVCAS